MSVAAIFGFLIVCGAIAGMFTPGFRNRRWDHVNRRYYEVSKPVQKQRSNTNIYITDSHIYIGDEVIKRELK